MLTKVPRKKPAPLEHLAPSKVLRSGSRALLGIAATHRREGNNRVRFLTEEEEKKPRAVIAKKWSSHLPELDKRRCRRASSAAGALMLRTPPPRLGTSN